MINNALPLCLLLIITILPSRALPGLDAAVDPVVSQIGFLPKFWPSTHNGLQKRTTPSGINYNPNGSAFVWLQQDEYSGEKFFE